MENNSLITAVNSLKKPMDKRQLLHILSIIRKNVDDSPTRLQNIKLMNETGCVKNLIGCLQMESSSILDITLSILGNCCIDTDFSKNSVKLNILHSLNRVLDKQSKDSIIGRVFRILGNLSINVCSTLIILKEPLLIDKIATTLNRASEDTNTTENITDATIMMGLRAIRKLLKKSTLQKLLIDHEVLKSVGAVLIKYVSLWELGNCNENILQDILRLLHAYSQYAHPHVVRSLKNTDKGDSLISLGKIVTVNPTRVIKIITNMNRCCSLKSDLPVAAVWQKLLEKLTAEMNGSNSRFMECLRSMYELVLHPCNRECMKLGDSVCQLINILRDFTICTDFSMECCTLIFSILSKCQYDDTLVLKQINFNIVNVLIEKLEWSGISSTTIKIPRHVKKKRKTKRHMENNKKLKISLGYDSVHTMLDTPISYVDRCTSPSNFSEISSTGPNSPDTAPLNEGASDSDNYSPVCSDADDTDVNSIPSLEPSEPNYASSSEDDDISLNEKIKYRFLYEINTLLWRYSRIKPAIMDLGNPKLLIILINIAISNSSSNSSCDLLVSIIRKSDYLISLMRTDFVQMVYDLTFTEHDSHKCNSCNRVYETAIIILNALTKVAESGGGRGDIAHLLLRSNDKAKDKIVIAIPYIIKSRHIIIKLLINCGGLDILLNLLEETSDIHQKSIKGICILAIQQLKIKNPVNSQPQKNVFNLDINNHCTRNCKNVVTFKLDDGASVIADRDFLSDKSDFFNRLLNGCFKESEQSEITLQNISMKSLKLLLMLLECNVKMLGLVNIDLNTLLDLLEITERYLLVELNVYLTGCVEQLHMSNTTVPVIYQWSIESGTNILRVETIAYALVGDIVDVDRLEMFHKLFNLGYTKQLKDDIHKLLTRFLR